MKNTSIRSFGLIALSTLVLPVLITPASARERHGSFFNARGGTGERNILRDGTGNVNRDTSLTGANGKTADHSYDRTWDPSTQSGTVNTSTTHANGTTSGRQSTYEKTGSGSGTVDGTYERANGQTGTYNATTTKTEDGRTTTGTITGANGKTATVNSSTVKTDTGVNRTTTKTGPEGGSVTTDLDVSHDGNTTSATRTVTPPPAPVTDAP
ncbi:MAG: hypothetical protein WC205_19010 [Opitutaceae bacterium]|jgi:hypothetical protein